MLKFSAPRHQFRTGLVSCANNDLDNAPQTNYLTKARNGKLPLIEGDSEEFGNILSMIDDYEGALGFRS